MRIAVVALNPCVDRTVYLNRPLCVGDNHRALSCSEQAAGKGLNQAVVLENLGTLCDYYSFGSASGDDVSARFIGQRAFRSHMTAAACGVRVNVKIVDANGVGTEINEAGGPVSEEEVAALMDALDAFEGEIVSICGSVPQGIDKGIYAEMISRAKKKGALCVLDADGEALRKGLAARPDYIKPNRRELAELVGKRESELKTDADVAAAARSIYDTYGTSVICTLDESGSLYVGQEGAYRVGAAKVELRGFSGAGDTYLAAFLHRKYGEGADMADALSYAARASGAKVAMEGTLLPTREEVDQMPNVLAWKL